jgi:hypothetical protein
MLIRPTLARLVCAGALLSCTAAQAVLITFDDLPWTEPGPDDPSLLPYLPIDNQYAHLGVTFSDALLSRWGGTVSPPQIALGGTQFSIQFTGELPRYVSFYITSTLSDAESWAVAQGPGGYTARAGTGGWPGGLPHPIPYPEEPVPNSFVSFSSPNGIARLDFENAYQQRFSAIVDNLYFGAVPPVPEPSPMLLGAAGLACLGVWRRRSRAR